MEDLNDSLVSEPDWELANAWSISDTGHIVGHGKHETYDSQSILAIYSDQAYLLYIPEPMCYPFIVLGSALFILLNYKHS